jgi:hypothetical protein
LAEAHDLAYKSFCIKVFISSLICSLVESHRMKIPPKGNCNSELNGRDPLQRLVDFAVVAETERLKLANAALEVDINRQKEKLARLKNVYNNGEDSRSNEPSNRGKRFWHSL